MLTAENLPGMLGVKLHNVLKMSPNHQMSNRPFQGGLSVAPSVCADGFIWSISNWSNIYVLIWSEFTIPARKIYDKCVNLPFRHLYISALISTIIVDKIE